MKRYALAIIFMGTLALAGGREKAATSPSLKTMAGHWTGLAQQAGSPVYPMAVQLYDKPQPNAVIGQVTYPQPEAYCQGQWRLKRSKGQRWIVQEVITKGRELCFDSELELEWTADGGTMLVQSYFLPDGRRSAESQFEAQLSRP